MGEFGAIENGVYVGMNTLHAAYSSPLHTYTDKESVCQTNGFPEIG